jgi:hypothetical protein
VVLGLVTAQEKVIHRHMEIRKRGHEGPRDFGDRGPPDGRGIIVDAQ